MGFLFLRLARKEPAVWSHGAHIFLHLPLSASLATLWPVLRRCWEEPLAPPPHTRGRMCSQRCPLWACFLSDGNKTDSKFMSSVCPMLLPCRMLCWEALVHRWYVRSSCAKTRSDWCCCSKNHHACTLFCIHIIYTTIQKFGATFILLKIQ